jgi:ParB/RepB/Spo0J family partition protein
MDILRVSDIDATGRIREDLGNLDELCSSIQEFGLIQPIVLAEDTSGHISLVAGGRRLSAIKRLGWKEIEHARHFIWRDEKPDGSEAVKLKLQAIELEENLKRKEMTWSEVALGRKRLLETMQRIHGVAKAGKPSAANKQLGGGFGVNKLASMLGASPASVSNDIQLAEAIEKMPELAAHPTAESARRKINILNTVAKMSVVNKFIQTVQKVNSSASGAAKQAAPAPKPRLWSLYETDFRQTSQNIPSETVDLVYTDLPYGVELDKMSKHNSGAISYADSRKKVVSSLPQFAAEAWRVLRPDRYAVIFFGFNYYNEVYQALLGAGFSVPPVPVVWLKRTNTSENPNSRYGNAYDVCFIAAKGQPVFIRPGRQNVKEFPPVTGSEKLQVAQQPVALVKDFLFDMTTSGALVVDFCAGTGTTGVACCEENRKVILFEEDPEQCLLIKGRLAKF